MADLVPENILVKVLIIGDSGVGKTSLLQRYVSMSFMEDTKPTIGADFRTKDLFIQEKSVTLQIWDTAGQERYAKLGAAFYRGTQACILVCDINRDSSVDGLALWHAQFVKQCRPREPKAFPFVVVANKLDEAAPESREAVREKIHLWWENHCKEYKMKYFETSARKGNNVDQVFLHIGTAIVREINHGNYHSTLADEPKTVSLDGNTPKKKCC